MAPRRLFRALVVAALVAAQPAAAALAAQVAALGGPCPVHAVLEAQDGHGAAHDGHAAHAGLADHAVHDDPSSGGTPAPADLNFACCVAHALGMPASHDPLRAGRWNIVSPFAIERGLESRYLAADDPPPRILL